MKKNNIPDLLILPTIFRKFSKIRAVYLFGSLVSGKNHFESDLDLALVPDDSSVKMNKLEILTELARKGFCNVDLIFLDTDDIVMKFEAIRYNSIIYKRDDFDQGSFFSKIIKQYFDFLPYLKIQREYYKRRIISGKV